MTPRPFALERFFARHEFTARYLLCSSDPESMSVGDLLAHEPDPAATAAELQSLWLGYTETWGHPQLREGIAALYEPTLGARSVLVHSGAEEPIFIFMHFALSRGDHLITHFPCYQSARWMDDAQPPAPSPRPPLRRRLCWRRRRARPGTCLGYRRQRGEHSL